MSRIVDEPYFTYSAYNALTSGIQVKCPKCHGAGVVTADDDNAYFRCLSCGYRMTQDRTIYRYDVHNQCKNCGRYYRVDIEDEAKQHFPVLHVACPYCGATMPGEVHKTAEAFSYGAEMQGGKDPWFGLELWFLTSFQGKPVWALNREHLAYLIGYLKGKGIHAVRQTVYGDLQDLILAGIDIVVTKSTQNQYFIGNRLFEYPELKMLTDAVASSKVISAEKTNELIQKLCRLTSEAEAMQLRRLAAISSRIKPHNEKVYYIIDGVQNAILENRQIQFQYYEYTQQKERVLKHNGYFYKLDPYALEWKNDHYYLIGYSHKHHGMAHFRVDRLAGIEVLESTYVPQPDFDVADYTNKMIDMFAAGHTVLVELLCENRFMKTIVDDYGEAVPTQPYDSEHFVVQIEVNPSGTFYGWVFKFMGGVKITAPQKCVEEMARIARTFL